MVAWGPGASTAELLVLKGSEAVSLVLKGLGVIGLDRATAQL